MCLLTRTLELKMRVQGNARWGVVTVKFPVNAYLTLTEGLNKLPSWTVYPSHL